MKTKTTTLESELKKSQFIITISILITCSIGFIVNNLILYERNLTKLVASTAHVLTQNLAAPLLFQDLKEASKTLSSLENHPVIQNGVLYNKSGTAIASFPENLSKTSFSTTQRYFQFPISRDGESLGFINLYIIDRFDPFYWIGYSIVALIVMSIGFFISKLLTRYTTRKILSQISRLLTVTKATRFSEDYSFRILDQPDHGISIQEISNLSQEFDWMLETIEARNKSIQRINGQLEKKDEERTKELKFTQAGLVQSSKMSALGEMSAGLAHEINNPLAIISGKSQQIIAMIDREKIDPETLKKHVKLIESTAIRISKIIKGLKSFSRDGKNDPLEDFKLKTILDDTLELCASRFESHGINFIIDTFDPNISILCRPTQISQVLLNLFNNAHDAIVESSEKWVKFSVLDQEVKLVLLVTDCGNGIPPEIQKKLMQPFFTTKEIGKGTGLGLSLSKGIIESHGGTLEINNECKNTCFRITIPKKTKEDINITWF